MKVHLMGPGGPGKHISDRETSRSMTCWKLYQGIMEQTGAEHGVMDNEMEIGPIPFLGPHCRYRLERQHMAKHNL